ncbi:MULTISPECIES: hypothetical protein [unclassified Synechococcus]|uniref:hypothetical protein n=1 Tax=unclassified Synechococcus TaxID=2626047 RepID=UPI001CF92522|nr:MULTISPECIES: hypothetical protein [unclassified Synechococcus]MCB4376668.1 hypothetical protein [Synechococcus sp. MU1650]
MTNLLATPRQRWFTRGRLLVGLPLGVGAVVSAVVVLGAVLPAVQSARDLEQRRDALLSLQRIRPALELQLPQAEAELRVAEEMQAVLVGLLAGRESVQTFLALLNQQAVASGVQLQRYEPLKTAVPNAAAEEGSSPRKHKQSKGKTELPPDPWHDLGYRKTSVALEVSGPFGGLHTFLQRMEALELPVESSELELKAVVEKKDKKDADSAQSAVIRTQLTLKLSFYDLAPSADPPPDVSASSLS